MAFQVDLVSPEFHPLAQRAKDVAAGAVLLGMSLFGDESESVPTIAVW